MFLYGSATVCGGICKLHETKAPGNPVLVFHDSNIAQLTKLFKVLPQVVCNKESECRVHLLIVFSTIIFAPSQTNLLLCQVQDRRRRTLQVCP